MADFFAVAGFPLFPTSFRYFKYISTDVKFAFVWVPHRLTYAIPSSERSEDVDSTPILRSQVTQSVVALPLAIFH
jgi:hypothetical protein